MKIDLTLISVALSVIVAAISIATSLWRITKVVIAKSRAQEARTAHLYAAISSIREELADVVFYLALPENGRGHLYPRRGTKNITQESLENYNNENTDFK